MKLEHDQIYRVRSEQDPTALIALDVKIVDGDLTWFDTHRDRGHRIRSSREDGDALVFETETGFVYRFELLTKDAYDNEVKPMVELSPEFESTEDLRRFYLQSFLGIEVGEPA